MCVDLCVGFCVCIFLRSPKVISTDTCFWSFLPHLWAPMGDPFTPPEPLLTKRSSMLATVMIFMGQTRLVAIGTLHLFMVLFQPCVFLVVFPPFLHGHGRPHDPSKTFTTNVLYLGPTSMMFMNKKPRQIHNKSIASGI